MKSTFFLMIVAAVLAVASGMGCLEEKVLEVLLNSETCAEFIQNETTDNFNEPATITIGQQIREVLSENGYSVNDIAAVNIVSSAYEVTEFSGPNDWVISGNITVDYQSGPIDLVTYTSQSVQAAFGVRTLTPMTTAGVNQLQQAIDDFLAGSDPSLTFAVDNDDITPDPSVANPMIFTWKFYVVLQVVLNTEVEVPDPF